jgi:hypothetical protein
MPKHWIAVLGSVDANRKDLDIRHSDQAAQALQEMGRALAEGDFGIIVYSADPGFIEPEVVAGYVASGKAADDSIRVIYPRRVPKPQFREEQAHRRCFRFLVDENEGWEVSFYRSLYEVDGLLLVGGGQSTFIAGIIATTRRTPIVALEGYGGAAAKVWQLINPFECTSLTKEDKSAMAEIDASAAWARKMTDVLLAQKNRLAAAVRKQESSKRERNQRLRGQGISSLVVLVLALTLFVGTWDAVLNRMVLLGALVTAPALAGAAASLIRRLWEQVTRQTDAPDDPVLITALLGCAAGIISGLLYVVAQLTTLTPSASNLMPASASRLVPFALLTGFLAGFAADAFFRKIRDRDVGSIEVPAFRPPSQSA